MHNEPVYTEIRKGKRITIFRDTTAKNPAGKAYWFEIRTAGGKLVGSCGGFYGDYARPWGALASARACC